MKKTKLFPVLFLSTLFCFHLSAQESDPCQSTEQATIRAKEHALKILGLDQADVQYHATYFDIEENPTLLVYTCKYRKKGVDMVLTMNLKTDPGFSLVSFQHQEPVDQSITIPYDKIITSNDGLILKTGENEYRKYPDNTSISREEILNNVPQAMQFPSGSFFKDSEMKIQAAKKSASGVQIDDTEVIIPDVPNYRWYLNCGLTTELMYLGYWNDHGYSTLIPGGDSENGYYWAVGEESCFWEGPGTNHPGNRKGYYAQAIEYGNAVESESIRGADKSWESFQDLMDTYQGPVFVGWQGEPYGAHATLGVGYQIIDGTRYFILHDTWYGTASYVSYDEYFESVSGYYYWQPTSAPETQKSTKADLTKGISLNPKPLIFSPSLLPSDEAYHYFEFADLNADGRTDLIVCNFRNNYTMSRRLHIYYGTDTGFDLDETFQPQFLWYECLEVAKTLDYDNDGDLDIALTGFWSSVQIFINEDGQINDEPIVIDDDGRGFIDMSYGDIDLDGDQDLIASTVNGQVRVYQNNSGTFSKVYDLGFDGQCYKVRFVDVDNDHYPEIIAANLNGTLVIYSNNQGTFGTVPSFSPSGHGGIAFAYGDVNNNGWLDLVSVRDGELIMYMNNDGSFEDQPLVIDAPGHSPKDLLLSNLDDDVYPELIVSHFKSADIVIDNADGNFSDMPAWTSQNADPSFKINQFRDKATNKLLLAFGKSREGHIDFVESNEIQAFDFLISALPQKGGYVQGAGHFDGGQNCTLNATSKTGYDFVNWTENGTQVSTDPQYSFTVSGDRTLVANFELQSFTINASADPTEGGVVSGAGGFDYGQNCTLSATVNTGYDFVNWTENGTQVSTDPQYSFTVSGDRTLVANFESIVGISGNNNQFPLIYPNPTKGTVYISGQNISSIHVYRMTGQIVKQVIVNSDEVELNLSEQSRGVYFLLIVTNEQSRSEMLILY